MQAGQKRAGDWSGLTDPSEGRTGKGRRQRGGGKGLKAQRKCWGDPPLQGGGGAPHARSHAAARRTGSAASGRSRPRGCPLSGRQSTLQAFARWRLLLGPTLRCRPQPQAAETGGLQKRSGGPCAGGPAYGLHRLQRQPSQIVRTGRM